MSDYCQTNDCEDPECHRCWPRKGCEDHSKCIEFTKSGEGYSEREIEELLAEREAFQ